MVSRISLASAVVLACLPAAGGCVRKKPPAPRPAETMVTVTVTGAVDTAGNFRAGGFRVDDLEIDGKDASGLAEALRAKVQAAAAANPAGARVRILVYPSTPYGVIRRILAAAAQAQAGRLALACITDPASQGRDLRFDLPMGGEAPPEAESIRLRVWPDEQGRSAFYELPDTQQRFARREALAEALSSRRAAGGAGQAVVVQTQDVVQTGFVADALAAAQRAGLGRVCFAPEALADPNIPAAPIPKPPPTAVWTGPTPPSSFSGASGRAFHVVYLIDRSGSMVATFDEVRVELLKSINGLEPDQNFHIVLFGGRQPVENDPKELVPATPAHKQAAAEFLKGVPSSGMTQPIPAIERAFEVLRKADPARPGKIIYLLTDGEFKDEMRRTDNEKVLQTIRRLNAGKDVMIHALLYGRHSPEAESVLRTIAEDSGGKYKFIEAGQ